MARTVTESKSEKAIHENVEKIAKDLVAKCRKQELNEAIATYYSPTVVTFESEEKGNNSGETQGIQAVLEKGKQWADSCDIHKIEVSDALVAGCYFSVKFKIDATCKKTNERMTMEEIALYHVEDDKIDCVEFLYDCAGQHDGSKQSKPSSNVASMTTESRGASPGKKSVSTATPTASGASPKRTAGGTETSTHNMSMTPNEAGNAVRNNWASPEGSKRSDFHANERTDQPEIYDPSLGKSAKNKAENRLDRQDFKNRDDGMNSTELRKSPNQLVQPLSPAQEQSNWSKRSQ